MPQPTLDKNEINILYAPFTNVDKQRVGCDLAKTSFEEAVKKLHESNTLDVNTAIYWVIIPIEEPFNAARILNEYLNCMSIKIEIIPAHLKSHYDWFIMMSKSHMVHI